MRLDTELVNRNFYPSRAKAVAAIKSGLVSINGVIAQKPSQNINSDDLIVADALPYVSGRGSLKLMYALEAFHIDITGFICLDVGASTGGFTEVLLNRGAKKVIAVEVGTNQIISELKNNQRVMSIEETDIRNLSPFEKVDLIVVDVSFISLTNIAENLVAWKSPRIITLIKPQFEVPKNIAAKTNGVIKSESDRQSTIHNVIVAFEKSGFINSGIIESPIKGGSGNIEYLALFEKSL
ncbi:MAG: TlyA family RNA methyltransferase [Alphaproteobacteria bacterium]|nr:TlyA family RNA methyltransferase [Alphaproteobacteria bacterium]MBN2674991.1 TlyA family RNA methyltransferase [Alphaproteobacteria bacterium]